MEEGIKKERRTERKTELWGKEKEKKEREREKRKKKKSSGGSKPVRLVLLVFLSVKWERVFGGIGFTFLPS